MDLSRLFQARIGPDGEIVLVPRGSKEDPWADRRRDNCPKCLSKGIVQRGKFISRLGPSTRGNIFDSYKCPRCGYVWVWDKRWKYWSRTEIERTTN